MRSDQRRRGRQRKALRRRGLSESEVFRRVPAPGHRVVQFGVAAILDLIGPCAECARKDIAIADSHELLRTAMKEHTQLREECALSGGGPCAWCPQCGPLTSVDEDGCCTTCGNEGVGQGADAACDVLKREPEWAAAYTRQSTMLQDALETGVVQETEIAQLERKVQELEAALNKIAGLGFCVFAEQIAERALGTTPEEPTT